MKINFGVAQLGELFNGQKMMPVPNTDSVLVVCVIDKLAIPISGLDRSLGLPLLEFIENRHRPPLPSRRYP